MIMRIPGVGSQYLMRSSTTTATVFDGAKTYKVTLPKGIPAEKFWSFTVYDNQTRSMLQTPQKFPRAGSQSYPTPAAEAAADGDDRLLAREARRRGARQLDPDHGRQGLVDDPAPLQPAAVVLRQVLAADRSRAGRLNGTARGEQERAVRPASPVGSRNP